MQVTELDFDQIKLNLKSYFKNSNSVFKDWDFEASGLNTMLDVLAYNTHYNAMLAHMAVNESFLASAQLRKNVVAHAALLGYTPSSIKASSAALTLVATGSTASIVVPRGTSFSGSNDNGTFTFITLDAVSALNSSGTFTFSAFPIYQGALKSVSFITDTSISNQKFVISDTSCDTTHLTVTVKANINATSYETYTLFDGLASATSDARVYFLNENSSGDFEISFGDGIFGYQPNTQSIVTVEYLSTTGEGDDISSFDFMGSLPFGMTAITSITTDSTSAGGSPKEDIESIRFNAPLNFIAQNRAITAEDYKAIILKEYGAVDSINVWGGELQETPEYGRVYISIKPTDADTLTTLEKLQIKNILLSRNMVTITPMIIDPDYVWIYMDVNFKYDSSLSGYTAGQLQTIVQNAISTYNDTELQKFDGVFRYSKLLRAIDASATAILSSSARVYLSKVTTLSGTVNVALDFGTAISGLITSETSLIYSSPFTYNGETCYIGDVYNSASSTQRSLYLYKLVNGEQVTIALGVGYLEPANGKCVISGFTVDTDQVLRLNATPSSFDIVPKRNQLLKFDMTSTNITGDVDTVATGGTSGATSYNLFSRDK